jgi:hypothetical protein
MNAILQIPLSDDHYEKDSNYYEIADDHYEKANNHYEIADD